MWDLRKKPGPQFLVAHSFVCSRICGAERFKSVVGFYDPTSGEETQGRPPPGMRSARHDWTGTFTETETGFYPLSELA